MKKLVLFGIILVSGMFTSEDGISTEEAVNSVTEQEDTAVPTENTNTKDKEAVVSDVTKSESNRTENE